MDYLQYKIHQDDRIFVNSDVLNLIINGLPSILYDAKDTRKVSRVLNLIINGLPSIHYVSILKEDC